MEPWKASIWAATAWQGEVVAVEAEVLRGTWQYVRVGAWGVPRGGDSGGGCQGPGGGAGGEDDLQHRPAKLAFLRRCLQVHVDSIHMLLGEVLPLG